MEKQKPTNPPASMQGVNPNPINKDKGTASQVTVNPKQDDIKAIRGKAYESQSPQTGQVYFNAHTFRY